MHRLKKLFFDSDSLCLPVPRNVLAELLGYKPERNEGSRVLYPGLGLQGIHKVSVCRRVNIDKVISDLKIELYAVIVDSDGLVLVRPLDLGAHLLDKSAKRNQRPSGRCDIRRRVDSLDRLDSALCHLYLV